MAFLSATGKNGYAYLRKYESYQQSQRKMQNKNAPDRSVVTKKTKLKQDPTLDEV